MTKAHDLERLLRLKDVRAHRARLALAQAAREAKSLRQQVGDAHAEYDEQFAETAAFARTRLGQLDSSHDFQSFFMAMSLGLYRRKRRLVSTGIRVKRSEAKAIAAERVRKEAAAALRRLDRSSEAVRGLRGQHLRAEDERAELTDEDELLGRLGREASHA